MTYAHFQWGGNMVEIRNKGRIFGTLAFVVIMLAAIALFAMPQQAHAYSTKHTQQEAIDWACARGNEHWNVDFDGTAGVQCVDLVLAYYNYLVGWTSSGNAIDYATNTLPTGAGWTRVYGNPQAGDIAVWDKGVRLSNDSVGGVNEYANSSYGHVGIVWRVNASGTLSTIETNTLSSRPASYHERLTSGVKCYIRPCWYGSKWWSNLTVQNLGNDFYASIILNRHWWSQIIKPVYNTSGAVAYHNVVSAEPADSNDTTSGAYLSRFWHFKRNSDGSYHITNTYYKNPDRALAASGNQSGKTVQANVDDPSNNYQKWYIYGRWSGEYIMRNAASDYVINVDVDSKNCQIWTYTNSNSEKLAIYKHEPAGKASLKVVHENTVCDTHFNWTKPSGAVQWVNLRIQKKSDSGKYTNYDTVEKIPADTTSYAYSLPAGTYKAWLVSHSFFNSAAGTSVVFTVSNNNSIGGLIVSYGSSGSMGSSPSDTSASDVAEAINDLPEPVDVDLGDREAIEDARIRFDALSDASKAELTNPDASYYEQRLQSIENALLALQNEETSNQTVADAARAAVDALPAPDQITLSDADAIRDAEAAVEALSVDQVALLGDDTWQAMLNKLDAAIEALEAIYAAGTIPYNEPDDSQDAIDISTVSFSIAKKAMTYAGKALKPKVKANGLTQGTDYSVSYKNNNAIGKAQAIVKGMGAYTGKKTIYFTIKPAKSAIAKATPGKKKIIVKIKAVSGKAKYLVAFKMKGKKAWSKTKTSKVKLVLKKLNSGKKYTVKVRAFKTVKGKTYYGAWSNATTVKVK